MTNKKTNKQPEEAVQEKNEKKFDKPFKQKGGIYFHAGAIIGRKNVFVTNEYIDLLVNAIKLAELKFDVKNIGYLIMPNFFYWMFKLSDNQDNPGRVYGEVKKDVGGEIIKYLLEETRESKQFDLVDLFKNAETVGRSNPQKILWTFEEHGKRFKETKRFRVWAPKTEVRLIDSAEVLQQKLEVMMKAPGNDRWQLVKDGRNYPYLYIDEEYLDGGKAEEKQEKTYVPVTEPAGNAMATA